jgi:hypothetical protein
LLCAIGVLSWCVGPFCSVCLPSRAPAPYRSAEASGSSSGPSVVGGPSCSECVPSWIPPFLCSTGWRLSLGSGVDGTVCAFAEGAKNCKNCSCRGAGAGPFRGPPGPTQEPGWRTCAGRNGVASSAPGGFPGCCASSRVPRMSLKSFVLALCSRIVRPRGQVTFRMLGISLVLSLVHVTCSLVVRSRGQATIRAHGKFLVSLCVVQ